MQHTQADNIRQLRAAILTLVYDNHRQQNSRLRGVQIAGALERLLFDTNPQEVATVLQDLKERGYLEFKQNRDQWTKRVAIGEIQITPKGRDLVEKTITDAGVDFA